jgi:uncharacterized protein DUF6232
MRTYYRGPDAFVTADQFVWLQETPRIVPVRELRDIHRVEQAARTRIVDAFRIVSGGLAAFAVAGWLAAGPVAGTTLAILAVSATVVAVCSRQLSSAKTYGVVATLRGVRTTVYESRDIRVFNQVTRALRRSVENGRRDHDEHRLATAS